MWIEIIGWIGGFEVLFAYFLISSGKVNSTSMFFQLLNLTGSILLIINTYAKEAYPSTFVNVVWVGIAGTAMIQYYLAKRKKK